MLRRGCAISFIRESSLVAWSQQTAVDPSATIGANVMLGPGVVIGPGAEIGDGTRIGPELGDRPRRRHRQELRDRQQLSPSPMPMSATRFSSCRARRSASRDSASPRPLPGTSKIPQLGRVIVQDRVEIGACTTIDRGALGDTVIGEGTKIDNLVQIGHNTRIGRHDMIVAQVGHFRQLRVRRFRRAGRPGRHRRSRQDRRRRALCRAIAAFRRASMPGGQDYGGMPAKPVKEWMREISR